MSCGMNTPTERDVFAIVLGLDLSDTASSGYAFDQAARIAARIRPSEVHAVYVLPQESEIAVIDHASGLLSRYITEKLAALGITGPTFLTHIRYGDAAQEIAQTAADVGADMIIVGTHKAPRLKTLFVGSTASRVMALTARPVLVAGPRPPPETPHVIVIEGPCPACVATRQATANREFWCPRHAERHHLGRHHVYSYENETPFDQPDVSVDPRGN
jgi:nucleotide-binding universal stress UspA family protein